MKLNLFSEIFIELITKIRNNVKIFTCGKNSNFAIASGYDIKANPAPPMTTFPISFPVSCAKFPKIPKITHPAKIDVNESTVVIIMTSLK